ncbi:hypothetical protein [Kibdelosporangium philippinense]|uniref:hypothetical protein n=1 Tax=Kibdelosporangium philippinense TaxID=211113 RepID=UPI00361E0387
MSRCAHAPNWPPTPDIARADHVGRTDPDRSGWLGETDDAQAGGGDGDGADHVYHHVRDKEDCCCSCWSTTPPRFRARSCRATRANGSSPRRPSCTMPWQVGHGSSKSSPATTSSANQLCGWSKQILAGVVDSGRTPDEAVHVYRSIWYYTAGEIMIRARSARRRARDGRTIGIRCCSSKPTCRPWQRSLTGGRSCRHGTRIGKGCGALVDGLLQPQQNGLSHG